MMIINKNNLYLISIDQIKQEKPCFEHMLDYTLFPI